MIYSYNVSEQNVDANGALIYAIDAVKTGITVTHSAGTSTFTLNRPGYYYVTVTASGAASSEGTDPISLALYNGTDAIPGAVASATSTTATDIVNLTINTIIPVRPSCCAIDNTVNLIVMNTGVATTFSNTAITITKLA